MRKSLRRCTGCRKAISIKAPVCPKCGEPFDLVAEASQRATTKKRSRIFWISVVALVGGLWALGTTIREFESDRLAKLQIENPAEYERVIAEKAARKAERDKEIYKEETERRKVEDERRLAEIQKDAERREAGFHCLSDWNGSQSDVVRSVKANLRNPDSFEHIETRIAPKNKKGEHTLIMTYRAQNGFGGMNVEAVTGVLRNSDCAVLHLRRP
jgi:hypothetical protein